MRIDDGTGVGYEAKVDSNNRLFVDSVSVSGITNATSSAVADSYNLNTGLITLTTAGESGLMYTKNNEDRDLNISGIVVIMGPSTSGATTDTSRMRMYRNPTTGTLISTALAADTNSNRNFGSSKALTADVYKGAEGNTITDGVVHIESLISPGNRVFFGIEEVLTKGNSIAVSLEPNDSNSNMKVMVAIICHLVS